MARPDAAPAQRSAISGICSLLLVGLLVGSSLSAVEPGLRELGAAHQRHAVRQLTVSVARAVRNLVGDRTHPGLRQLPARPSARPQLAIRPAALDRDGPPRATIRVALLNLPPPAPLA